MVQRVKAGLIFHAAHSDNNQSERGTGFPVPFVAVPIPFVAMAAAAKKLQKLQENENLIGEVEKRPALWNIQRADYRNIHLKSALWDQVAAAVDSPVEHITTRCRTLRDTFLRKLREVKESRRSGAGANDTVKVTWPHFAQLMFLKSVALNKSTIGNIEEAARQEEEGAACSPEELLTAMVTAQIEDSEGTDLDGSPVQPTPSGHSTDPGSTTSSASFVQGPLSDMCADQTTTQVSGKRKSRADTSDIDKEIDLVRGKLMHTPDQFEHFALSLCEDMRKCPTRLVTQMKIEILNVIERYKVDS